MAEPVEATPHLGIKYPLTKNNVPPVIRWFFVVYTFHIFISENRSMRKIYMSPYIMFNLKTKGHENCIQQFTKTKRDSFCQS